MSGGELTTLSLSIGVVAFSIAALLYAGVAVLLLLAHHGSRQSNWLLGALTASAFWCASHVVLAWQTGALVVGLPVLDAIHVVAWLLFLSSLLSGPGYARIPGAVGKIVLTGGLVLLAVVVFQFVASGAGFTDAGVGHSGSLPLLGLTLLGLLALEQIYRNSSEEQGQFLRWLVGGVGTVIILNTVIYSQALLFSSLQPRLWAISAVANTAVAPAILVAIRRQPDWGKNVYVSRQLVFYTTALTGAGLYLVAMGIVGFLIGTRDEPWGVHVQLLFLALAGGVFVYGIYSADVRRWARVFVSKHFFRERYDYREEWIRLSRALAAEQDEMPLAERSVRALGNILSSPSGTLWLENPESGAFEYRSSYGQSRDCSDLAPSDQMIAFLRQTQWVVDTREYLSNPGKYGHAFDASSEWLNSACVIVPLIHAGRIVGLARFERPAMLGELNFKDHDLLKTAGQQVAVFLMQQIVQEVLAETRQFEAYSKLTAFLMHDLKNMVAQQELIVGNARRFRDRPEFIDDAIRTLDSSVGRMRRLIDRFRGMAASDQPTRIDLDSVVKQICSECADREPAPVPGDASGLSVAMDRDKLTMCLTHAIRNAQDATESTGTICVSVSQHSQDACVEVRDTGSGMDAAFIRDSLFRPFVSTRGAQGMGIGAYQMRETMHAAGGVMEVESTPGSGTTVRFRLPSVA